MPDVKRRRTTTDAKTPVDQDIYFTAEQASAAMINQGNPESRRSTVTFQNNMVNGQDTAGESNLKFNDELSMMGPDMQKQNMSLNKENCPQDGNIFGSNKSNEFKSFEQN